MARNVNIPRPQGGNEGENRSATDAGTGRGLDRRRFIAMIGSALAAPLALAQVRGKVFRVGFPTVAPLSSAKHLVDALELGLRDQGYVIGRDVVVEHRSADGRIERLSEVVRELVRGKVDVFVTGVNRVTATVKAATQSIPIVMTIGSDVVGAGFAKSLAKPGGNITGFTIDVGSEVVVKRFELLKDISPKVSRVAVLSDSPAKAQSQEPLDKAASVLGLSTFWLKHSGDLDRDFADILRWRSDAVFSLDGGRIFGRQAEFVALATKHRLPTSHSVSEFVDAGGLMSYGPNIAAAWRGAARHVDKILKGAKPGDIPVEQPTVIDLTINLKTARTLGLKIPPSLLLRAVRVIE